MNKVLYILAAFAVLVGMLVSNQLGIGPAVVGLGCFLGLTVRMRQANKQHAEMLEAIKQWQTYGK